jgi:hypothetical protein
VFARVMETILVENSRPDVCCFHKSNHGMAASSALHF